MTALHPLYFPVTEDQPTLDSKLRVLVDNLTQADRVIADTNFIANINLNSYAQNTSLNEFSLDIPRSAERYIGTISPLLFSDRLVLPRSILDEIGKREGQSSRAIHLLRQRTKNKTGSHLDQLRRAVDKYASAATPYWQATKKHEYKVEHSAIFSTLLEFVTHLNAASLENEDYQDLDLIAATLHESLRLGLNYDGTKKKDCSKIAVLTSDTTIRELLAFSIRLLTGYTPHAHTNPLNKGICTSQNSTGTIVSVIEYNLPTTSFVCTWESMTHNAIQSDGERSFARKNKGNENQELRAIHAIIDRVIELYEKLRASETPRTVTPDQTLEPSESNVSEPFLWLRKRYLADRVSTSAIATTPELIKAKLVYERNALVVAQKVGDTEGDTSLAQEILREIAATTKLINGQLDRLTAVRQEKTIQGKTIWERIAAGETPEKYEATLTTLLAEVRSVDAQINAFGQIPLEDATQPDKNRAYTFKELVTLLNVEQSTLSRRKSDLIKAGLIPELGPRDPFPPDAVAKLTLVIKGKQLYELEEELDIPREKIKQSLQEGNVYKGQFLILGNRWYVSDAGVQKLKIALAGKV